MKYDLNGKSITIPDAEIDKSMTLLSLTKDEAIELYLFDNGHITNDEVDEMTAKAKVLGPVTRNQADKPKRKAPERKPDMVKRQLVAQIEYFLGVTAGVESLEITNIERMIAFEYEGEKYELTLTKKRKPKK